MMSMDAINALKRLQQFSVAYGEFEGGKNQRDWDIETIHKALLATPTIEKKP